MSIKKLSKIRKSDPHFQREAAKYQLPLPSREYVLSELEKQGKPVSYAQLCALMDIHESEEGLFQRRLAAMEREGQLMRNRKGAYILPERASLIAGASNRSCWPRSACAGVPGERSRSAVRYCDPDASDSDRRWR